MHGLFTSFLFGFLSVQLVAQDLDSVHVFKWQPDGQQTLASAHTLAWRLHLERAPHTTLQGEELTTVAEAMHTYHADSQPPGPLPDLAHIAMVFSGGRPVAFGVSDDLERLINLTARRSYSIRDWEEHAHVRALLAKLLIEH